MSIGFLDFSIPTPGFLDFGRDAGSEDDNELTIAVTLSPLTGSAAFWVGYRLRLTLRVLQGSGWPWGQVPRSTQAAGSPHVCIPALTRQTGQPSTITATVIEQAGQPLTRALGLVEQSGQPMRSTTGLVQQSGQPQQATWSAVSASAATKTDGWRVTIQAGNPFTARWRGAFASGQPYTGVGRLHSGTGHIAFGQWGIVWQQAKLPPHGWRAPRYVPSTGGKHWGRLNFVCPLGGTLNFGNACFGSSLLLVPIHRSYRVLNTASLIRVADSVDIPVTGMTVGLDQDSWCWTLQADLPTSAAMALVPAAPAKVRATINSFAWDFIVDEVTWDRSFGAFRATLQGRSPAAIYAEPYALAKSYRETAAKTAEQLALQELGPGWALDWQLPMWTVPGGVFQYENLTIIEVIKRIAQSAGGWLYADAQDDVLHIVPKWPQKPWSWSFTPDASLPSSYVLSEAQQPTVSTEYESLLVTGGKEGVAVVCTRAGTGGATVAPAVVDTLITDLEPAQGRAIQELADLWPMKRYTLTLPLQAQPTGAGLILPGTTFDFVDGAEDGFRGLVTGVSIAATWGHTVQNVEVVSP